MQIQQRRFACSPSVRVEGQKSISKLKNHSPLISDQFFAQNKSSNAGSHAVQACVWQVKNQFRNSKKNGSHSKLVAVTRFSRTRALHNAKLHHLQRPRKKKRQQLRLHAQKVTEQQVLQQKQLWPPRRAASAAASSARFSEKQLAKTRKTKLRPHSNPFFVHGGSVVYPHFPKAPRSRKRSEFWNAPRLGHTTGPSHLCALAESVCGTEPGRMSASMSSSLPRAPPPLCPLNRTKRSGRGVKKTRKPHLRARASQRSHTIPPAADLKV